MLSQRILSRMIDATRARRHVTTTAAAHPELQTHEAPSHDSGRRASRIADTGAPCDEFCPLWNVRYKIGGGISNQICKNRLVATAGDRVQLCSVAETRVNSCDVRCSIGGCKGYVRVQGLTR